jgi:RNA polymerase sigma-70 factor (ECF subfamily)
MARRLDPQALAGHLDRIYRAALALCNSREDAEDLVQETYAKVLAKPRRLKSGDELGYLLVTLRNTYFTSRRTASRRPRADVELDAVAAADPRPDAQPAAAAELDEVFGAIAALPDDFRDALVAVDVAGLSYGEAAKLLGTKEATITSRLHRARARVAAGMEQASGGVIQGEVGRAI